jgi:hypothetical protein
LALIDMVVRGLYEQQPQGFLLFSPDASTKRIFRKAIDELTTASFLEKHLDQQLGTGVVMWRNPAGAQERLRRASIYVSGSREEAVFSIDQANAAMVMRQLAKHFPERDLNGQARRLLEHYIDLTELGKKPVPSSERLKSVQPGTGGWMQASRDGALEQIDAFKRQDADWLRAAVELSWNIQMWIFSSGLQRETSC